MHYTVGQEGALFWIEPEDVERFSAATKAVFVRLGQCEQCRGTLEPETLRCSKSIESGAAHKGIWVSRDDLKEVETFVAIENRRDKNRERAERRTDAMRHVPGFHTRDDIASILKAQQGNCYYCGKSLTTTDTRRDHMMPVADQGSEWPSNIALACVECNHMKSTKGAVAFWNYLRKTHGAAWVTRRTKACQAGIKLKQNLTVRRKAELAEFCADLQRKLNKGVEELRAAGTLLKPEYVAIYVQHSKNGIRVELDTTTIAFPPSSHRRVKAWAAKQWPQILNALLQLESAMGTVTLSDAKAVAKTPQEG